MMDAVYVQSLTRWGLSALNSGREPAFLEQRVPDNAPTPIYDDLAHPDRVGIARLGLPRPPYVPPTVARLPIPARPLSYRAHARRTDPPTSHEAARSVVKITETHQRVLTILSDWGQLTDEQMHSRYNEWRERRYGWPPITASGLRTRRKELVDMGKVVDSGERGTTAAGRACVIWRLADG